MHSCSVPNRARSHGATAMQSQKGGDCIAYSTHSESYKHRDAITLQVEVDCPMRIEKCLVIASRVL